MLLKCGEWLRQCPKWNVNTEQRGQIEVGAWSLFLIHEKQPFTILIKKLTRYDDNSSNLSSSLSCFSDYFR